jgi:hypothetical protein
VNIESGIHYTTGKRRDRKIDTGIEPAGRWTGSEAGNANWWQEETQNVGSGQGENRSSSKSTMGQDPGREEIEASTNRHAT